MNRDANFWYCVGIITSDGNLSSDGRHISITSKDLEVVGNCRSHLKPDCFIGKKSRGGSSDKKYFVLQFSDVKLYTYLVSIGLAPRKSKTIAYVKVEKPYFKDFLRGLFDGDGSISIFKNKLSKQAQVKIRFASASCTFLEWLKNKISHHTSTQGGYITNDSRVFSLNYGKSDSFKIIKFMYYTGVKFYLGRKYKTCLRAGGETVDSLVLGTSAARHGGSSPPPPTTY